VQIVLRPPAGMGQYVPYPATNPTDDPAKPCSNDDRRDLARGVGQVDRVVPHVDVSVLCLRQGRQAGERVFAQEAARD